MVRLYASTGRPSAALILIIGYVVVHFVTVPMWFQIRRNSSWVAGVKNLHHSLVLLRDLPDATRCLVQPVITRNSHWAHPEQALLAMATGADRSTCEKAVQLIREARERQRTGSEAAAEESAEVRPFCLPTINFRAAGVSQLINWHKEAVTEPPLLRHLDDDGLRSIIETLLAFALFPVHSQSVGHAVKTVTEACSKVFGEEARRGTVIHLRDAQAPARRLLTVFNCKQNLRL